MRKSLFLGAQTLLSTIVVFVLIAASFVATAQAATIKIVALGASNTVGKHGGSYPADLQAMLREKGYDVEVINAGVNGDTTAGMLARVNSAVPVGTRLVLISPAAPNDKRVGIRTAHYADEIVSRLQARNIKALVLPPLPSLAQHPTYDSMHYSAEGYREIAAKILPMVIEQLGSPGK